MPAGLLLAGSLFLSTFELSGTVLQEPGIPLTGATLTLLNETDGSVRRVTTGDSGRYSFPALVPGVYSLEVAAEGYATSRYAGLRYFADTKPVFNVTLQLREVQESVTFTGEAPLVNVSQAQVGLSVESRQLRDLPLERRDYLELAPLEGAAQPLEEQSPGAADSVGAPRIAINGQSAEYTRFRLDGLDNTRDQHGVALVDASLEPVVEFRVLSGQYSAEYGHALAGIVSATTDRGSNDFHGSVFAFVKPGSWSAADPLTDEEVATDRQDLGFTFGGPLRRERTHFFASFQSRNQNGDVVVTAPFDSGRFQGVYELPDDSTRFLAKLSHLFNDRHQLELTAQVADRSARDGVGGFDVIDNAVDIQNDDVSVRASVLSTFDSVVSELRLGFASERFRARAEAPSTGFALRHPLLGNIGSPTRYERVDEDHFELSERLAFSFGNHGMTAGGSVLRIGSESELDRFSDGLLLFPARETAQPILLWQSTASAAAPLSRDETHVQLFLQDDWQMSPFLTLNLGLRWERESSVPDNDNVAPRLGVLWDATRDGRTSVRAGYGVFYSFVFSIADSLEALYGPDGRHVMASSLVTDDRGVENHFVPWERRSPFAHHVTFGVERELWPSLSAAVDVSHVRGESLIRPFDENAPTFFDYTGGGVRSAAEADASRPMPGLGDRYRLASTGRSRIWNVRAAVTKRFASSYTVQGVYQWSQARDDGDDYRIAESLPLDPSNIQGEWGPAANDVPHAFALNGVWEAPYGFRLAGLLRARSGRPVDPRAESDLDGDRKLRERGVHNGQILERNSFRAPGYVSLDLSIAKSFPLTEGRRIEAAVDVFNLTNRLNPRQVLRGYGTGASPLPSFLEVVQAAPPRQFQLSLRFVF